MATITPTEAVVTTRAVAPSHEGSYVDWPAIIAGIVLASAISLLMLTFGSALGLSLADFNANDGANPTFIAIAAGLWLIWVQVSSFMAGGYITGRLRRRMHDASEHESDVRDGAHGLLVWAGALIIGAWLAVSGIGAAANAAGSALSTATQAASNVAGEAAQGIDPNAYFIDTLFRPAAGAPAPAAGGQPADPRAEAGRLLAQSAVGGEMTPEDRTYLATQVSQATGLPQPEAEARVDQVNQNIAQARQQAADAADAARRTTVLGAFILAASLLISAVGAFWAAQKGGNHRDENTPFADVFRRF